MVIGSFVMATSTHKAFPLKVFVYREGEYWVAHCVELDIVTSDTNRAKVARDIVDICAAQFAFALTNGLHEHLFRPTNKMIERRLLEAYMSGKVEIDIQTKPVDAKPQIEVHLFSMAA